MPTMYLTKYALTDGVKEIEATESSIPGYVRIVDDRWSSIFKVGSEVFATLELAHADAEKRRLRKVASLKKQIAKLEKLTF